MKVQKHGNTIKVWLSANDTYAWANRSGESWPCSYLANKRLFAKFQGGDLVDISVNGKDSDVPSDEFNAIIEDYLGSVNPE